MRRTLPEHARHGQDRLRHPSPSPRLRSALPDGYISVMNRRDIPFVHRHLKAHFETHHSPVSAFMQSRTNEPYRVLVATILSSRTKDQTTEAVSARLFQAAPDPASLRLIPLPRLETLLHPVGFFRTKARLLKKLPDTLDSLFQGEIPQTVEELIRLPGVGRKTANLVVSEAFDKPGICVDVHVHRICNRLGLLVTRTPEETERVLRRILPVRYWKTWSRYLVAFGQTLCSPRNPKCTSCPIRSRCARMGVKGAARTKSRRSGD